MYKARYGFNFYETTPPALPADLGEDAVLIFSKTNGYRHGDAIKASLPAFEKMAVDNGWSLFVTDNGAVFNPEQLRRFRVVVWNNTSGNLALLVTDKDWGMGEDHPVVWYHEVGEGRAFYSALGHQAAAFREAVHLTMLENGIRWAGQFTE